MKRLKRTAIAALAVVAVVGLALAVVACSGRGGQDPEAQRLAARAVLVQAEARAEGDRIRAETNAAAERANVRQMERDAAHARALELLPFVVVVVGAVGLAGLAGLIFWDLRTLRKTGTDAAVWVYLERAALAQAERDRVLLDRLERIERQALAGGQDRGVVIYRER